MCGASIGMWATHLPRADCAANRRRFRSLKFGRQTCLSNSLFRSAVLTLCSLPTSAFLPGRGEAPQLPLRTPKIQSDIIRLGCGPILTEGHTCLCDTVPRLCLRGGKVARNHELGTPGNRARGKDKLSPSRDLDSTSRKPNPSHDRDQQQEKKKQQLHKDAKTGNVAARKRLQGRTSPGRRDGGEAEVREIQQELQSALGKELAQLAEAGKEYTTSRARETPSLAAGNGRAERLLAVGERKSRVTSARKQDDAKKTGQRSARSVRKEQGIDKEKSPSREAGPGQKARGGNQRGRGGPSVGRFKEERGRNDAGTSAAAEDAGDEQESYDNDDEEDSVSDDGSREEVSEGDVVLGLGGVPMEERQAEGARLEALLDEQLRETAALEGSDDEWRGGGGSGEGEDEGDSSSASSLPPVVRPPDLSDDDEETQPRRGAVNGTDAEKLRGVERRMFEKAKRRDKFLHEQNNSYSDPERDRRTIFVGNIPVDPPQHRTKQALTRTFKPFGAIESMRFRSFSVGNSKLTKKEALKRYQFGKHKPTMNAYIVYTEAGPAREAVERCNGKTLTISYNRTDSVNATASKHRRERTGGNCTLHEQRTTMRVDLASGASYVSSRSVFIGNIPFSRVSEDQLRSLFAPCGPVTNVRIIRDKVTGLGKGFGYVEFAEAAAVEAALQLSHRAVPPAITVDRKVYELRILRALKPMQLARARRVRKFVKKGGRAGLVKRTKRWKQRRQRRHELKTGVRPAAGPLLTEKGGAAGKRERPEKTSDTELMTKGQRKAKRMRERNLGTLAAPKKKAKRKQRDRPSGERTESD